MTDAHRPTPGEAAFTERLLERLRGTCGAEAAASITLDSVRASSRNTVIYRVRTSEGPLVCKAEVDARPASVDEEYRMLLELQQRLAGSGLRSLTPLAVYPELRVLVTREEPGESVRRHIQVGLSAAGDAAARRFAEGLMASCAEALYRFHAAFGLRRDEGGVEGAHSYLDFDPRNLIVRGGDRAIVLLDPPREEIRRPVHHDIGVFCFGMARSGFTPRALARFSQDWLDRLKADFIGAYFRRLGRCPGADDLARIRAAERHRAGRLIARYSQFFRYAGWPRELARMAYFTPIIGAYLAFHLPRSYRRLARARPLTVALEASKRG